MNEADALIVRCARVLIRAKAESLGRAAPHPYARESEKTEYKEWLQARAELAIETDHLINELTASQLLCVAALIMEAEEAIDVSKARVTQVTLREQARYLGSADGLSKAADILRFVRSLMEKK